VQYPEYHNSAYIQLGFDVDTETGVVAACQERVAGTHHEGVQLFSLYSGHKLDSPFLSRHSKATDLIPEELEDCNIKCLRFVREGNSKIKSLYVMDCGIQRYAWVPEADTDWSQ
jgi:hypothetical protein